MHKSHTTLLLCLSLFSAFVSVGAFLFFFHIIANKNQHTAAVLSTLARKTLDKQNTDALVKKVAQVKATSSLIERHFVDTSTINTFVNYLEQFGVHTNTQLTVKDVQSSALDKNHVLLKVSIRGTFKDVAETIALLENSMYQIHITELYINKDEAVVTTQPKGAPVKPLPTEQPIWQADVTFNVLSL